MAYILLYTSEGSWPLALAKTPTDNTFIVNNCGRAAADVERRGEGVRPSLISAEGGPSPSVCQYWASGWLVGQGPRAYSYPGLLYQRVRESTGVNTSLLRSSNPLPLPPASLEY